jgi:hypothetical protein
MPAVQTNPVRSTENKLLWCKFGLTFEEKFVSKIAPYLGLDAKINPEKETNKYSYDLIVNGRKADLKHQNSPFFLSQAKFGLDPTTVVSFNHKDYTRYKQLYPDLVIYFWVERTQTSQVFGNKLYTCQPLHGIWSIEFSELAALIESGVLPLHEYERRKDDKRGNARDSFIIDLSRFSCLSSYTNLPSREPLSSKGIVIPIRPALAVMGDAVAA